MYEENSKNLNSNHSHKQIKTSTSVTKVEIVGLVTEQGFFSGIGKKNNSYCFFTINTYSSKKWRNLPCVVFSNYKKGTISPGMKIKVIGDLAFCFSEKFNHYEMKINVEKVRRLENAI